MVEYGLVLLIVVIFGLPLAFNLGMLWAASGRVEDERKN